MNDPTRAPRETLYHRRDRADLIQLLAAAHARLDALGVPRTTDNTPGETP